MSNTQQQPGDQAANVSTDPSSFQSGEEMEAAVKKYMENNRLKIMIGTPCYGGLVYSDYLQSVTALVHNFTKLGIEYDLNVIGNESLITRARNGIVARFFGDPTCTHLMFIDADVSFSWVNIVRLILTEKEFCGGGYPKKMINWSKVKHFSAEDKAQSDEVLMAKSLDYVFNPIVVKDGDNMVIPVTNGLIKVKNLGTGFMLLKKSVITKMMSKYKELKYRNNVAGYEGASGLNISEYFYTLFDTGVDPESKVYLSEDYLFCERWGKIGGEIWMDLRCNLNHTGNMTYRGCLAMSIGQGEHLNKDAELLSKSANRYNNNSA
jgi:hypothetical protein